MAGEKSDNSTNPSAIRIRDNQRRSRARHKEYVEGLQTKLQDYERRGVEATLEMQQAARNVALENSRLRMLLGYHGVATEEVDKFLQAFPDQPATEAAKATISRAAAGLPFIASAPPKIPLQPLSRSSSTGPANPKYIAPLVAKESSTREVLDAIVGIKRETRMSDVSSSGLPQPAMPEQRQSLLQPRPPGPTLPALPALILGQTRPDPNHVDRLSVLASASMQDSGDGKHRRAPSGVDSLHVPSPPTMGQSPPSSNAGTPGRLNSASPRSQDRRSKSPFDKSPFETSSVARVISDIQGTADAESTRASLGMIHDAQNKNSAGEKYGSHKPGYPASEIAFAPHRPVPTVLPSFVEPPPLRTLFDRFSGIDRHPPHPVRGEHGARFVDLVMASTSARANIRLNQQRVSVFPYQRTRGKHQHHSQRSAWSAGNVREMDAKAIQTLCAQPGREVSHEDEEVPTDQRLYVVEGR